MQAADFSVATYAELVTAIDTALTNGFADTITLTADITLEANLVDITSTITINGGGHKIDGDGKYRPFNNAAGGILTLNNLIIEKAYVARASGTTPHGASIRSVGELNLNRVVVRNGKTDPDTSAGQHSVGAGGIFVGVGTGSVAKIKDSAIYNNRSRGEGTGIRIAGGTVTIINTSIFGNESSHGRGSGIYLGGTATLNLYHSTVTANKPNTSGESNLGSEAGGGIRAYSGTLSIVNSIIFGNDADDCAIRSTGVTISQIAGNIIESGSTSNCTTSQTTDDPDLAGPGVHGLGSFYIPRAGSPAIDAVTCLAATIDGYNVDQRGEPRPRTGQTNSECDIGAIEHAGYTPPPPPSSPRPSSPPGGGGPGGSGASGGAVGGIGMTPAETCADLMKMAPAVEVSNAGGGTACQEVEPAGYGHPDLAAEKPASVVDVWGEVTAGTQVCFQATGGKIRYVDTSQMKRTVTTLSTFSKGNMICATIDGPGQVALIQDGSAPGGQAPAAQEPAQQQAPQAAASSGLNGCMVKTQGTLNFRQSPAGDRLEFTDPWGNANAGWLPAGVTLTAVERSGSWLKVDYYGTRGWVSAAYVTTSGSCG